jgi:hypothetical protein
VENLRSIAPSLPTDISALHAHRRCHTLPWTLPPSTPSAGSGSGQDYALSDPIRFAEEYLSDSRHLSRRMPTVSRRVPGEAPALRAGRGRRRRRAAGVASVLALRSICQPAGVAQSDGTAAGTALQGQCCVASCHRPRRLGPPTARSTRPHEMRMQGFPGHAVTRACELTSVCQALSTFHENILICVSPNFHVDALY